MKREPVQSSTIASIGYDVPAQVLEICFKTGKIYRFYHVPPKIADGLMASVSKGRFFREKVRGKFPHEQVKEGARIVRHPVLRKQ